MRLFLASRIKAPKTFTRLEKYLGGFKGKKIALVPTASNAEDGWEYWKKKKGGTWEKIHSVGAKVTDVVLENYRDRKVIKELRDKDVIWFMGGMPGYLMYWIRRCSIDLFLRDFLKRGTIYVGSSAGAMIAGQTLQVSGWKMTDGERGAESIEPLKLVNFDIFPHFQESYLPDLKKKYLGKRLYLLKDGEEIIVEDGKINFFGEERMIKTR